MYKGTGASPGIAIGKALVLEHSEINIERKTIENVEAEVEKLQAAIEKSRLELEQVKERAKVELGEHEAEIFEAHLLVLADPELVDQTIAKIRDEKVNAEFALNEIKDMFVSIFESMDNEYMRERAADIKDVTNRVLRHILGIKVVDLSALSEEVILIAHDLTPSDTATMNKKMVLGFLTDIGGRTSHTAIMARTLEIAAIVGLNDMTQKVNADYALNEIKEMFVAMFESMDNEYMRERAADIKDVTNRVLRHILGIKVVDLAGLDEEVILIAHDLTPSDTATMNKNMVLGFLTDIGGRTSHTAIMARTLEIAAIVGLNDITKKVKDGDYIVFNGDTGEVIVNPDEETKAKYISLKQEFEEYRKSLELLKGQASITTDKRHVELAGNIGSPNDVEGLIKNDAEGVGLYRTEFLYMDKEDGFPTEEEQYEAYKAVLEGMKWMSVSPGASGMQPRDPFRPWRGTLASGHKPR